jgi:AcrR family transcriptional regulator
MSTNDAPRSRRGARARAEILRSAREVARRDGTALLTMQAVAEHAGVSKPAVHYHFNSKETLMRSLAVDLSHEEIAAVTAAVESAPPGPAIVTTLVRAFVEVHVHELELFRVQYLWSQVVGIDTEVADEVINPEMNALFSLVERRLEHERARGRLAEGTHSRRVAVSVWSSALGLVSMLALLDSSSTEVRHVVDELVDSLCSALVGGVFS